MCYSNNFEKKNIIINYEKLITVSAFCFSVNAPIIIVYIRSFF